MNKSRKGEFMITLDNEILVLDRSQEGDDISRWCTRRKAGKPADRHRYRH